MEVAVYIIFYLKEINSNWQKPNSCSGLCENCWERTYKRKEDGSQQQLHKIFI